MTIEDFQGPTGLALVRRLAAKFDAPRGLTADDMESAGGEGLAVGLRTFDPGRGVKLRTHLTNTIRHAIQDAVRGHVGRSAGGGRRRMYGAGGLTVSLDEREESIVADTRIGDPADIAAAREVVLAPRRGRELGADLPAPAEVAARVATLRAAMFGAIDAADVGEIMAGMVAKAKGGNVAAAKLVFDVLSPGRSGVTVQQQTIVVAPGDVG